MADLKKIAQQFGEKAAEVLRKVDTPEKAVKLTGEERSEYLDILDKVFGKKDVRAKDMGFGDTTYYHGTANTDIDKFKPATTNMVVNNNKPGSYFTPHPEGAAKEAFYKADKVRDKAWSAKLRELEAQGLPDKDVDAIANLELEKPTSGEQLYPVKIREDLTEKFTDWGVPSDSVKVENPGVRSTNAAFDPRFKDSDLILAANSKAPDSVKDLALKYGSEAMDKLALPQRAMLNAAAKALGKEGSAENSEESAAQIADAVVSKFVPEDSEYLGPALKAAGTAGLETFADPTGPIIGSLQKVAKGVKMGVKAVNALGKGAETAETIYKRTKPVRATEEINRVKNAAETYVGRKGLADKAAQEQARSLAKIEKEAQSMGKMQNPEAQFVDIAARQKALDSRAQEAAARHFGTQIANAKTTDEIEQLRARMEVFKDLFKKHNQ